MEISITTKKHKIVLSLPIVEGMDVPSSAFKALEDLGQVVDDAVDGLYVEYVKIVADSPAAILELVEQGTVDRLALEMAKERAVELFFEAVRKKLLDD